jgi:hypothetical protein
MTDGINSSYFLLTLINRGSAGDLAGRLLHRGGLISARGRTEYGADTGFFFIFNPFLFNILKIIAPNFFLRI